MLSNCSNVANETIQQVARPTITVSLMKVLSPDHWGKAYLAAEWQNKKNPLEVLRDAFKDLHPHTAIITGLTLEADYS